jgi:hypothetical protein
MFEEGDDTMLKIEILAAPQLDETFFKLDIINEGRALEFQVKLPNDFVSEDRTMMVNEAKAGFNADTYEAQSFKKTCEAIHEDWNFADDLYGAKPQVIALPFRVEDRIVDWECQGYPNDGVLTDRFGGLQFHNAIAITTRKLKRKKKVHGRHRVFGGVPAAAAAAMDEDDEEL